VFDTQIFSPSKIRPPGEGTEYVATREPLSPSLLTVPPPKLATQTFAPSKVNAVGTLPTGKFPTFVPSLALIFVTVAEPVFATQIFDPSHITAPGEVPTETINSGVPSLALILDTDFSA
jgi:hypothetical protein